MPYYMGDYYQGDPGFFGGLVRMAVGPFVGAARAGVRAVRGTLAGAGMAQAGTGIVRTVPGRVIQMGRTGVRQVGGVIARHPVLSAAGAAGTVGVLAGRGVAPGAEPMMAQRGFHVSARTGALVRNRRMRVTNPRALRRAIRRCIGFARLAKRVLRFTSPKPPRGRAYFKTRRRSAGKLRA